MFQFGTFHDLPIMSGILQTSCEAEWSLEIVPIASTTKEQLLLGIFPWFHGTGQGTPVISPTPPSRCSYSNVTQRLSGSIHGWFCSQVWCQGVCPSRWPYHKSCLHVRPTTLFSEHQLFQAAMPPAYSQWCTSTKETTWAADWNASMIWPAKSCYLYMFACCAITIFLHRNVCQE